MELEEQNSVGESLVRHLVRTQLHTSLGLASLTMTVLFALPLLFCLLPEVTDIAVFGIRLPWLLLGLLPFPFLVLMGYVSTRKAERHERDFMHMVEQ